MLPKNQHHLSRNLNAEPPGVGGHVFHVTQSCMDTYLQFITNHETVYCLAVLRNRRRLKILKPLSQASFQKRWLDGARLFVANLAQAEKLQFFWRSRGMLVDRTTCKFATGQRLVKTRSQYHPNVGSPQEGQACTGISSVCNVKELCWFTTAISSCRSTLTTHGS